MPSRLERVAAFRSGRCRRARRRAPASPLAAAACADGARRSLGRGDRDRRIHREQRVDARVGERAAVAAAKRSGGASPMMSIGLPCDHCGGSFSSSKRNGRREKAAASGTPVLRRAVGGDHARAAAVRDDGEALALRPARCAPARAPRRKAGCRSSRARCRRGAARRRTPRRCRRARRCGSRRRASRSRSGRP